MFLYMIGIHLLKIKAIPSLSMLNTKYLYFTLCWLDFFNQLVTSWGHW